MSSERISLELVALPASTHASLARRLLDAVAAWKRRFEQSDALAGFDDRMLRDIGLTKADVWRELRKPWLG